MASEVPWQDLEVEELKVTSAVLTAGAHYYGQFCKAQNDAFMECREYGKDPRKCLKEGKEVTLCARRFFQKLKDSECAEPFTTFWTCLDYNNQFYEECKKTRKRFDSCMVEKLNMTKYEY